MRRVELAWRAATAFLLVTPQMLLVGRQILLGGVPSRKFVQARISPFSLTLALVVPKIRFFYSGIIFKRELLHGGSIVLFLQHLRILK